MDATPPLPAQDMMMKPMEEIITNITSTNTCSSTSLDGRRVINPRKDSAALNCPRCNSSNTKFCYYNNYSLAQPRYFCRTCRRYWTQGGSLRDIPIGGKTRKNKRKYSSTPSPTPNINLPQDLVVNQPSSLNPNPKLITPHAQDFSSSYLPSMEVFKRNNDASSMGLVISPYMPMPFSDQNPNPVYTFGLPFQGDFRASLGLSLDAIGSVDDHQQGDSTGYWNGNILGGDGSW